MGAGSARIAQLRKSLQAVVGLVLIILLFSALAPTFRTPDSLLTILQQSTELAILAAGTTVVLISGGLDLSVGSVLALSACVAGTVLMSHASPLLALAAGVGAGLAVGLVNGLVVVATRVPPFIVTLGTMGIAKGVALMVAEGKDMSAFPEGFKVLGQGYVGPLCIAGAVVVLVGFLLGSTRFGFNAFAIGGNREVARLCGIAVSRNTVAYYALGGLLAGLAACVQTARFNYAAPNFGEGWELQAIAAVVIGGTSLFGGTGGVGRTVIGALIMKSLEAGLNHCHVGSYWQMVTIGGVIILTVWLDRLQRERKS